MERSRVAPAARSACALLLTLALWLASATAASAAAPQSPGADRLLIDAAGWHGRAIQRPHHHDAARASTTSPPRGWSAGPVSLGAGLDSAAGSRRVREVQRRLRRLGYHPGPVDGRFGPRTQAALAWFQHKHGLPLDGRATAATVGHLRARAGGAPAPQASPSPGEPEAQAPSQASTPAAPPSPAPQPQPQPADDPRSSTWWALAAFAVLLAGLALAVVAFAVERRRGAAPAPPATPPVPRPAPVVIKSQARTDRRARALGYVRLAQGAPSASFHAQAAAIEAGCLSRGMTLVSLVSDLERDTPDAGQPPALAFALSQLGTGGVDRLVVSRVDHLARTREELRRLLESISERRAGLVVLDRDVDTAALEDPAAADEILGRHRRARITVPEPLGREVIDAHIVSMLGEGVSRREAVAALNAEPVPPPRGAWWGWVELDAALRRGVKSGRTGDLDA